MSGPHRTTSRLHDTRRFELRVILLVPIALLLAGCAASSSITELQEEVAATERAFAATMAARDHAGFASFLSEETVFFSGPHPLRGSAAVADYWKKFFIAPEAPFSWAPETVEVLESGTLALSTGPVRDPSGKLIATFTSIWRREAPGVWRIVFDHGCDVCSSAK